MRSDRKPTKHERRLEAIQREREVGRRPRTAYHQRSDVRERNRTRNAIRYAERKAAWEAFRQLEQQTQLLEQQFEQKLALLQLFNLEETTDA
jgi:hypothetical protein